MPPALHSSGGQPVAAAAMAKAAVPLVGDPAPSPPPLQTSVRAALQAASDVLAACRAQVARAMADASAAPDSGGDRDGSAAAPPSPPPMAPRSPPLVLHSSVLLRPGGGSGGTSNVSSGLASAHLARSPDPPLLAHGYSLSGATVTAAMLSPGVPSTVAPALAPAPALAALSPAPAPAAAGAHKLASSYLATSPATPPPPRHDRVAGMPAVEPPAGRGSTTDVIRTPVSVASVAPRPPPPAGSAHPSRPQAAPPLDALSAAVNAALHSAMAGEH